MLPELVQDHRTAAVGGGPRRRWGVARRDDEHSDQTTATDTPLQLATHPTTFPQKIKTTSISWIKINRDRELKWKVWESYQNREMGLCDF